MIAIYLGRSPVDSTRVILNGVDISSSVVAVEAYGRADGRSQVVLTLLGPVEIHGEPGVIEINPRPDAQ